MSRPTTPSAHPTNDAAQRLLCAAFRSAVERLEHRQLLSGSTPQAQPAAWHVSPDTLAVYLDVTNAGHTATIDWNDGSPPESLLLDELGSSPARPATGTAYGLHAYAGPGARTVTLTLADAAGHATTQQFTALAGPPADEPLVHNQATFCSSGGSSSQP